MNRRRSARYVHVEQECSTRRLVIRDIGPWDEHPTVRNDAEGVVADLFAGGHLPNGRHLFYYDSDGQLSKLVHHQGEFLGFSAVYPFEEKNGEVVWPPAGKMASLPANPETKEVDNGQGPN